MEIGVFIDVCYTIFMATHLAIFIGDAIEDILTGRKTIECRLSQKKVAPYGFIKRDDLIYLKQAGEPIVGEVTVDNVLFFTTDEHGLTSLRRKYQKNIQAPRSFWKDHDRARYATLIWLKNPRRYLTPLRHDKRDRRAWVVLG